MTAEVAIIIPPDADTTGWKTLELPADWQESEELFKSLYLTIGCEMVELVSVLVGGKACHMVVDESGLLKNLPYNSAATGIYLGPHLGAKGAGNRFSPVVGTAVLFPGRFA